MGTMTKQEGNSVEGWNQFHSVNDQDLGCGSIN
jgi:hypothetical protein